MRPEAASWENRLGARKLDSSAFQSGSFVITAANPGLIGAAMAFGES